MKRKRSMLAAAAVAAVLFLLTLGVPRASADTFATYQLINTNVSSTPLVTVTVDLNSAGTQATITLVADQPLGMIDGSAVDLNVNGAFTLVSTTSNGEPLTSSGTGNVDHIGSFTLELSMQDASTPATSVTVVLSGSWASASSVLTATGNGQGNSAGVHFKTSDTCTFFAGDVSFGQPDTTGCGSSVPDGGMTLMLLGGVLVGVETLRRKFRV